MVQEKKNACKTGLRIELTTCEESFLLSGNNPWQILIDILNLRVGRLTSLAYYNISTRKKQRSVKVHLHVTITIVNRSSSKLTIKKITWDFFVISLFKCQNSMYLRTVLLCKRLFLTLSLILRFHVLQYNVKKAIRIKRRNASFPSFLFFLTLT